jgi:hypothetical protein
VDDQAIDLRVAVRRNSRDSIVFKPAKIDVAEPTISEALYIVGSFGGKEAEAMSMFPREHPGTVTDSG